MRPVTEEDFHLRYVEDPNGCWLWTRPLLNSGYAYFGRGLAHRWAYEHFVGPIPPRYTIDHLCRTKPCVNPAHLEAVTSAENTRRHFRTTVTHCRTCGADYSDPANIYLYARGGRRCRRCTIDRVLARQRREQG